MSSTLASTRTYSTICAKRMAALWNCPRRRVTTLGKYTSTLRPRKLLTSLPCDMASSPSTRPWREYFLIFTLLTSTDTLWKIIAHLHHTWLKWSEMFFVYYITLYWSCFLGLFDCVSLVFNAAILRRSRRENEAFLAKSSPGRKEAHVSLTFISPGLFQALPLSVHQISVFWSTGCDEHPSSQY